MTFEAVIGLEIHAELETHSKMFCACPVVDVITAQPNTAVCPVCAGMPGVLPVINEQAIAYAIRVALALQCEIAHTSIFERKNYFYPDLPKGYQISQYQHPLAVNGQLEINTSQGPKNIRIRRVHIEEDTGKSTHIMPPGDETAEEEPGYSLVDLNRAGVPLLEIVTEPDFRTPEEVRAYAQELRSVLRYLGVNSGDMQKGVLRIEPNISVRPAGSQLLGTRTEVKNLNSFRALERSAAFEINRQIKIIQAGGEVIQETVGWDETRQITFSQRSKEEAHDYRYFPEPDLPPLVVEPGWIQEIQAQLPELPAARANRFQADLGLSAYDAEVLVAEPEVAAFFDAAVSALKTSVVSPKTVANWITGDLFSLMNQSGTAIQDIKVSPADLANLLLLVDKGTINNNTANTILTEMFASGTSPQSIIAARGLQQISDQDLISEVINTVLSENKTELQAYLEGKTTLENWFFGQVMRKARGQANPQVVKTALAARLAALVEENQ